MSLVVAVILLVNFVFEFQKMHSRRKVTQSVPRILSQGNNAKQMKDKASQRGPAEKTFPSREEFLESLKLPQETEGPLKYGTITIVDKKTGQRTLYDPQAKSTASAQAPQGQTPPQKSALLAERVKGILPNFDNPTQEKINEAIKDPGLISQVISYTDELIKQCDVALAENENDPSIATKKEHLAVLRSVLISVLNE